MDSGLCPGYKFVERFSTEPNHYSDNDNDNDDEEITYVTLDLGDVEPQLVPSASAYRLIGVDTPTPYLQVHGTIMKGRHDSLLGTELIFTDDKEPHERNKRSLIHVGNTSQRITFQEITLIPKKSDSQDDNIINTSVASAGAGISPSHFLSPQQPLASSESKTVEIDKLTGSAAANTTTNRASRPKKKKQDGLTTTITRKGKEKEKTTEEAVVVEPDPAELATQATTTPFFVGNGIGEDTLEDIYMD